MQQKTSSQFKLAVETLEKFESAHHAVIEEYRKLMNEMEHTKDVVKNECRESGEQPTIAGWKFIVTQPYKKWYDYKSARTALASGLISTLDEITKFEQIVDSKKFDALVEAGVITNEVRVAAYREEKLTPRVSVEPAGE